MKENISRNMARYIAGTTWEGLSPEVVERTKLLLLDYLASAMAGYHVNKQFNDAIGTVYLEMGGKEESTAFLWGRKMPAAHGALLNAALGHGADMDDGHRMALGHPGVTVMPVALALGEALHLSGKEIILAIVAGYQVFVKIAKALNPAHFEKGFHTTGTVGTLAATATAAKLLKLEAEEIANGLSLGCLQSSGLLEVTSSGQMAKPFQPAQAAYHGIIAALMAKGGVEGPAEIFEGNKGFLKVMAAPAAVTIPDFMSESGFEILNCYLKLYPACRHIHGPIDAALELNANPVFSKGNIKKIRIVTYPAAIKITGNIYFPRTADEAKFSMPYAVAVALYKGRFTLDELEAGTQLDSQIREVIEKIEIVSDPAFENREAQIRGAQLEVMLTDGSVVMKKVNLPKGDPEVPVTKEEIAGKMAACAKGILSGEEQRKIVGLINDLQHLESIHELCDLLKKPVHEREKKQQGKELK